MPTDQDLADLSHFIQYIESYCDFSSLANLHSFILTSVHYFQRKAQDRDRVEGKEEKWGGMERRNPEEVIGTGRGSLRYSYIVAGVWKEARRFELKRGGEEKG